MQMSNGSKITYNIIPSINNTFGYDILIDGKITIHQISIPGMSGRNGFRTKSDAAKVVEFIITKMKKGIMPPSITVDEMKKMNLI